MRRLLKKLGTLDWPFALSVLALTAIGLLFVASTGGPLGKQLLWVGASLALFLATISVDYRRVLRHVPWLYLGMLAALVAVFATRPIHGARSWFRLGPVSIQPSEFMKAVAVVAVAHVLMFKDRYLRLSGLAAPLAIVGVPMALILRQPDMGTSMTFIPMIFAVLFAAGARPRHLVALATMGAGGMGAASPSTGV